MLVRQGIVKWFNAGLAMLACGGAPGISVAAVVEVRGKVVMAEGHVTPACRRVYLRRSDTGAMMAFRLPDNGADQSDMAVALTGVATGLDVQIAYDSTMTSGCGSEPKVIYISLFAAGTP